MDQLPSPCCHSMLPTITEDPAPASHSGFSRGLLQILTDPSKTIGVQLMANLPGSALILSIVLSCNLSWLLPVSPKRSFRHPFLPPHSPYHPWSVPLASLTWPSSDVMVWSTLLMLRSPYSPIVPRLLISLGLLLGITFYFPSPYSCLIHSLLHAWWRVDMWTRLN